MAENCWKVGLGVILQHTDEIYFRENFDGHSSAAHFLSSLHLRTFMAGLVACESLLAKHEEIRIALDHVMTNAAAINDSPHSVLAIHGRHRTRKHKRHAVECASFIPRSECVRDFCDSRFFVSSGSNKTRTSARAVSACEQATDAQSAFFLKIVKRDGAEPFACGHGDMGACHRVFFGVVMGK